MNTATTNVTDDRRQRRLAKPTVMVEEFDYDKVREIAQAIVAAQYGGDASSVMPMHCAIGLIPNTDDGWGDPLAAVICNEGVGWEQDDRNTIFVPCWQGINGVRVGTERLLNECRTGEEIDLANFIRSFGDRLEGNFHTWHSRLTIGGKL